MEPTIGASLCLICYEITEKQPFVPYDAPAKIFRKCKKYLHSTLTKDILKDIQLNNENQLPLCKSCFDSAWELTQLSEQLTTIQKDISDLTVTFSMEVFHRRSQVYSLDQMQNNSQSSNNSLKVEFNEACPPPNLFPPKSRDKNIQQNTTNHEILITSFDTQTDIVNVKIESNDLHFGNLSGKNQLPTTNADDEIHFNKNNIEQHCGQSTIEENRNNTPLNETRIVHLTGRNDSRKFSDRKNRRKITVSELLKTVQMPELKLERISIESQQVDVQNVLDEPQFMDDEFSDPSYTPNITRQTYLYKPKIVTQSHQKSHKCSYCGKGYRRLDMLQIHERIHTREKRCTLNRHEENHFGEKPFKCAICEKRFSFLSYLKSHERIHTGEKPFKCSFCKKKFSHLTSRINHVKTHTGEKPYECSFCKKKFIRATDMKIHQNIHTGEKPYKCSFCEKKFAHYATRLRHERIHNREKPYPC